MTSVALDPAFHGGIVQTSFGSGDEGAGSVIVLKDGRALVSGYSEQTDGSHGVLAAYNKDGSLSNSFDGDGKLILTRAISQKLGDGSPGITQTPDGGVLLIGASVVLKLKLNGQIDTAYGTGGFASLLPSQDSSGNYLRTSSTQLGDGTLRDIAYETTGALRIQDLSAAGKVTRSISKNIALEDTVSNIGLDAAGISVLATRNGTLNKVYRYNFDLTPMTAFGTSGVLDLLPAFNAWAKTKEPWTFSYGDPLNGIPTDLDISSIYAAKSGIGISGRVAEVSGNTTTSNPPGLGDPYTQIDFSISADGKTIDIDSGPVKGTLLSKTAYDAYPGTGEDGFEFGGTFRSTNGQSIDFDAEPGRGSYSQSSSSIAGSDDTGYYVVGNGAADGKFDNGFLVTHTAPLTAAASTATIIGTLYNDDNGSRYFDADSESLNAGKVVYIDANNNGKLDSGEKQTTTNEYGRYQFSNVAAGTYHIRRVLPNGYQQTTPLDTVTAARGEVVALDIGSTARGIVRVNVQLDGKPTDAQMFVDSNKNGVFDNNETMLNSIDDDGTAQIALPAGTYRIGIIPPAGTQVANGGPAYIDVTVKNVGLVTGSFTLTKPSTAGSMSGALFNDDNINKNLDSYETINAGRTVFLDTNDNGILDAGEHRTTTDSAGRYNFSGLAAGTYFVERVLPAGYQVTDVTATRYGGVNVFAGQATTLNIGSTAKAIINGDVSTPLPDQRNGLLVYVDLNKNGKDDSGEPSTLVDNNGRFQLPLPAGSYRLVVATPANTVPASYPKGYADITVGAGTIDDYTFIFDSPSA